MKHLARSLLAVALLSTPAIARGDGPAAPSPATPNRPTYPPTPTGSVTYVMHGETIADPYRWLEDNKSNDVVEWDRAQQALTRARLDGFSGRAAWKARIDAELDLPSPPSLPAFEGGREWWTERPAGANLGVVYARSDDGTGEPKVMLDPNSWTKDGTAGLRGRYPSPDGKWLAYFRDAKGSEKSTVYLLDLATGKDVPFQLTRMQHASFCWAPDSQGFFYSRQPDPDSVPADEGAYHNRVYYHPMGGLILDDELIYGTGRPAIESMGVSRSSDDKHVFLGRGMPYGSDDFFEIMTDADGRHRLVPVLVGVPAITSLDTLGDQYVLLTDLDAPRKRLVAATRAQVGDPKSWRTLVPQGEGVIEAFVIAGDSIAIHVRENVVSHLRVVSLDGSAPIEVPLPAAGNVGHELATKRGDTRVWFSLDAYERPWATYQFDASKPTQPPVASKTAPTTIDVSRLSTERATYPSKDGTRIPIFLLHRKDVPLDGKAPTMLSGYGGFRVGRYPGWNSAAALWADAGGVYGVACLRGGDEFGEDWHMAGCLGKKQNVFDDFIAGADWLVETGRARRDRLAIQGGSNGGLLVAACVNQRPDLCRAAACSVPLTDMLRFHRFDFAKTWTMEYGNPDEKDAYGWIRPYSPAQNVRPALAYPAVLLTAGANDTRVNAFHARKMAALWQTATTSDRPILLSIDRDSGHGSSSQLQRKADLLDKWTFLWQELAAGR